MPAGSRNAGWVFGSSRRPGRLSPFPSRLSGFTRQRRREVQFDLGILLFVVLETHGLLASPSRSGLRPSFPAWPILAPPFGIRSASLALPTSRPTMPSADFCPAVKPPFDSLSRRSDTEQISWGKHSRLPCTVAGSTFCTFDGYGLRGKLPARPALTPHIRFLSIDSHVCSTASFGPRLATIALALSLALHLHQVGRGTFTPKLLSMPSTQLNRFAVVRIEH